MLELWCHHSDIHFFFIYFISFFIYFFQTFCFYDYILQPFVQYNGIIHMFIEKNLNKLLLLYFANVDFISKGTIFSKPEHNTSNCQKQRDFVQRHACLAENDCVRFSVFSECPAKQLHCAADRNV